MSIDLDTHRNSILKAFNDVVSEKSSTDWALFGYEGQTNTLKVVGSGEDGLEELAEDLNTGKIMYAVVRVTDPNTTRNKHVLINWQGEGAPNLRKGVCQRHLNDVHKLLHGVHVTLNARTEEEVEPEFVMAAILKASASTYNFSDRSEIKDKTPPVPKPPQGVSGGAVAGGGCPTTPTFPPLKPKPKMTLNMGTNYKRTNPLAEINSRSRNKFWEEQEAEEKRRKTEEQQKKDEELKRLEKERRQREILESQQRDIVTKERNARISTERRAEEAAAQRCAPKVDAAWQNELENQQKEECERAKRAETMRLERKKEAESLIGKRTHSTRAMFETGGGSSSSSSQSQPSPQDRNRPPPRKLKEFKPVNTTESREETEGARSNPSRGVAARWPPAAEEPQQPSTPIQRIGNIVSSNIGSPANSMVPSPSNVSTPVNSMASARSSVGTPVNSMVPTPSTPPAPPSKQPPEPSPPQEELGARTTFVRNLLREGLPVRSDSDEEDRNNDDWDEPEQNMSVPLQQQQQQEINKLMNNLNLNNQPSQQQQQHSGPIEAPRLYRNQATPASPLQPPVETVLPSQPPVVVVPPSPSPVVAPSQPPAMAVQPSQTPIVAVPPSQPPPSVPADPEPHHEPPTRHVNGNAADSYRYENIDTITGHQKQPYEAEAYGSKAHTGATNGLASSSETAQNAEVPGIGMIYEVDGIEYQILPEHGLCARALYDYQAADDSEITFDPSEIITNIDQIDEGWWQGIGPDGMFGLFPANYVELINQPPI